MDIFGIGGVFFCLEQKRNGKTRERMFPPRAQYPHSEKHTLCLLSCPFPILDCGPREGREKDFHLSLHSSVLSLEQVQEIDDLTKPT